ncbi:electron transport complex subunit RsxE [Lachnospiraceae bacterium oral taxon 500]|nr:electron transport complex subunit RsxE [Lachnospiraceae bacterium oral taxon 500]
MNIVKERIKAGIVSDNPIFVQVLGMCPTLAVTSSAINGVGMGLSTTVVLVGSNMVISMLRKIIPAKVRIPAFIVVIATFVTIIDLLLQGFIPSLYSSLGLFIPLIVVNCIVLGRAEAYASKNGVLPSLFDGLGMGLGFTVALLILGSIREILGAGQIFGITILPLVIYQPITIFLLAPGAFIALGVMLAVYNYIIARKKKEAKA